MPVWFIEPVQFKSAGVTLERIIYFNPEERVGMQQAFSGVRFLFISIMMMAPISFAYENAEQQDWYQIEAILFEHEASDLDILRFEHLQRRLPASQTAYLHYVAAGSGISPQHIEALPEKERILLKAHNRLSLDPLTKPIFYYAWRQALGRDKHTLPIKIFEGPQTGPHAMFEGYIKLRRSRYTHMAIDVFKNRYQVLPYDSITQWLLEDDTERWPISWLLKPMPLNNAAVDTKGVSYLPVNTLRLAQSRRVKDGEVHYIDHPAMGLIITIKSIAPPDAELTRFDEEPTSQ